MPLLSVGKLIFRWAGMAESYREFVGGFSTADAECVEIDYRRGELELRFLDWRATRVVVRFPSAVAFRWQDGAALPANIRDDECYEVVASDWLAKLNELGSIGHQHRHYKLCFNAEGILDVVSHVPEMFV